MKVHYGSPDEEAPEEVVSVDGLHPDGLHLSNRPGNETPDRFRADLSTECAWRFIRSVPDTRDRTVVLERFETDAITAAVSLSDPEAAEPWEDVLVGTARAGAFHEYPGDRALRLHLLIQGYRYGEESPLTFKMDGREAAERDAIAARVVLGLLPDVVDRLYEYESVWWDAWQRIQTDREAVGDGTFEIERSPRLDIVRGPRIPHPLAVNEVQEAPYVLLVAEGDGHPTYRLDAAYHAWADTVERPSIPIPDLAPVAQALEGDDRPDARWQCGPSEQTPATTLLRGFDSAYEVDEVRKRVVQTIAGRREPA